MKRLLTTISAGLLSLVSAAALAADTGGHPGACKPLSLAEANRLNFTGNSVTNISTTQTATLTCPAIRISTSSPTILYVDYKDSSATAEVTCGARIWHWNSKTTLWSQSKSSGVATVGSNAFKFTLPSSVVGYVEVQCVIPPVAGGVGSLIRGFNLQ